MQHTAVNKNTLPWLKFIYTLINMTGNTSFYNIDQFKFLMPMPVNIILVIIPCIICIKFQGKVRTAVSSCFLKVKIGADTLHKFPHPFR